ncbi:MAG TPA: hypothetical protein VEP67_04715 [Thiobacillaceae bacterium]|nr:hypothetical protein [Thiobacillaceae bacterium]
MDELFCWRCGASLSELSLPLERRDECPACRAQLHVCKLCEYYDPKVAKQCREPIADEVKDKDRANFCGYFQPNPRAYQAQDQFAPSKARADLDALFGGPGTSPAGSSGAKDALDKLFGKD